VVPAGGIGLPNISAAKTRQKNRAGNTTLARTITLLLTLVVVPKESGVPSIAVTQRCAL
jgi:hypothetical protein